MGTSSTSLPEVVRVDKDKCENCHTCISACPVKLCNDGSGEYVTVNADMCIGCGTCLLACTHDARQYVDDFDAFLEAARDHVPMVAIVAPAAATNFPGRFLNLNGWLKSQSVEAVFDVSYGAELASRSYVDFVKKNNPRTVIAQPCPAIVTFIEIYQPDLLPYLAPVDSPMVHTMKMVRRYYPQFAQHRIVVVSPCLAKKREFQETGLGDYNVAFASIQRLFEERQQRLEDFPATPFDNAAPERAVLFSTPGGLLRTMERWLPGISSRTRKIEGPQLTYEYLRRLPEMIERGFEPLLIDCLNCELGCNGGTLTLSQRKSPDETEYWIEQRCREMRAWYEEAAGGQPLSREAVEKVINQHWEEGLYDRAYVTRSAHNRIEMPSEEQKQAIYRAMHKYSEADFFNCSSCGYTRCENMAVAIANGLNRPENCHHFLSREREESIQKIVANENRLRTILETLLEGFLEIDLEGCVKTVNAAMANILGVPEDQLPGRSINDFFDAENRAFLREQGAVLLERGNAAYEITIARPDRTQCICFCQASLLYEQHGESDKTPVGSFAMVTDITDRKRAEEELVRHREHLEQMVEERTAELSRANQELRDILENLQRTQAQLVESEKMAALAGLVAGVAHEINTPVGIGVTAASHLEERTRDFAKTLGAGGLKRSDLDAYVRTCAEGTAILLSNLRRAGELVQGFKRVAVDQSSQERRKFDVKDYLKEVLQSLHPKFKKTPHSIEVVCPEGLIADSYPGALSQVVTNLAINSLLHGFEGKEKGAIAIKVWREDGTLFLRCADDGNGIPPEHLGRIFEPFFTTKRGQGGSGLGMHIVYNLVTQTLRGRIQCSSEPGQGTVFLIEMPMSLKE